MQTILEHLGVPINDMVAKSSPEQIQELLPLLRSLGHHEIAQYTSEMPITVAVAHVITGKSDEYIAWIESFDVPHRNPVEEEEEAYQFFDSADLDDAWKTLNEYYETQGLFDSRQKRIEVVTEMWKLAAKSGFSIGSGHFQSGVQESCEGCRKAKMGTGCCCRGKNVDRKRNCD